MKLLAVLILLTITAGCVPNSYPAGATPYQKWKIDRYYEDRNRETANDIMEMNAPKQYKWY